MTKVRFTGGGPLDGDELEMAIPQQEYRVQVLTVVSRRLRRAHSPWVHVYRLIAVNHKADPTHALYRYEGQQ